MDLDFIFRGVRYRATYTESTPVTSCSITLADGTPAARQTPDLQRQLWCAALATINRHENLQPPH